MKNFLITYFIFCFSFLIFFSSGFVDSQDGLQYLAIARRIYYDHTIEMPKADYSDRSNIHFNTIKTDDEKIYAPTGIGYSLALIPAVALEDIFLRVAEIDKIEAFPLQNDWPVLLFASMTNSFFGALFIISFYYYLRLLKINHSSSLFLSFFLSIASNIFIFSKHTFAHMMFVSFMFLTFTLIKKNSLLKISRDLFYAGLSFGVMLISYNSTYLFTIPAILLYYLILNFKKNIFSLILNFVPLLIGVLPFYLFNLYVTLITRSSWAAHQLKSTLSWLHPYVFVEGFWGILFSPGKSLFLYCPILLIIIIFWHKLNFKKYKAEILSGLLLFITYLFFTGTLMGGEDYLIWHGDSSFANRYMLATIPFFLVFISLIYVKLNKKIRFYIFYPILLVSILVQIVGVSQPYQIRFAGLQTDAKFNGRNFNVYEYGNIIPRYSPLLSMSKKFVRKIADIKISLNPNRNKLKFFDGFGYPFGATGNYWRSMEKQSYLEVPKSSKIALKVVNHQIISTSTYSAELIVRNGTEETSKIIKAGEDKVIELISLSNLLSLNRTFINKPDADNSKDQVMFVTQAWVNDEYQNLNSIDYPYVSPISKSLLNINYQYWGNKQVDPWSIWHMHSGVYEKTFDFWWLRPFQYWDLPKELFMLMLTTDLYLITYCGYKIFKSKID